VEVLIVAGICLVMILGFIVGLNFIDRRLEKNPSMKKKPSTPRPRNPPKGQRPPPDPPPRYPGPVETSDFWMPRLGSYGPTGDTAPAMGIAREPIEWKCEYCGAVNQDVATCHNCGSVCTQSERIEKVRKIQVMSPDKPIV